MVVTLFENEVRMKGVTTLGYQSAHALNDPVRLKILEILSHKQMTTEEVSKILRRAGHKKATTTIRHHLDTLKNAGLIEVTKMVEVRGTVAKYYMPTLRAFSYNVPNLEKQSRLIEDTSSRLLKVLKSIFQDDRRKKSAQEVRSFKGDSEYPLCLLVLQHVYQFPWQV
jgi:DNA-binding transcriptional ArsR family regulator